MLFICWKDRRKATNFIGFWLWLPWHSCTWDWTCSGSMVQLFTCSFDNIFHPFRLIMHNTQCQEFLEYLLDCFWLMEPSNLTCILEANNFVSLKSLIGNFIRDYRIKSFHLISWYWAVKNPEFFRVKHLKSSSFFHTVYHLRFPFSYFIQYIYHCKLSL